MAVERLPPALTHEEQELATRVRRHLALIRVQGEAPTVALCTVRLREQRSSALLRKGAGVVDPGISASRPTRRHVGRCSTFLDYRIPGWYEWCDWCWRLIHPTTPQVSGRRCLDQALRCLDQALPDTGRDEQRWPSA
jgi:hypothetical protein